MRDQPVVWVDSVIARYGQPDGPDRVRIPVSQAALARATGRSAGTVTYYLRRLGPLVERRNGALVVDLAGLAERRALLRPRRAEVAEQLVRQFGQVTADGSSIELIDGEGPPTVRAMAEHLHLAPSSVQRHLHSLQDTGEANRHGEHLTLASGSQQGSRAPMPGSAGIVTGLSGVVASLAETARQLTELAGQLLVLAGETPAPPANLCAPEFAREQAGLRAEVRDLAREKRPQTSSDLEKERKLSVFSLENSAREFAHQSSRTDFAGQLSREQLDTLVAPLHEACKRYGNKPGFLDDNGRRYLARLSEDQLKAGVDQVVGKLKANTAIDRPFGLLVARARAGDQEFFTPPPTPPSPAVVVTHDTGEAMDSPDPEAEEAITAMSVAELDALDSHIAAGLSPAIYERLRHRPAQLARLRRLTWRQRNEARPHEEQ